MQEQPDHNHTHTRIANVHRDENGVIITEMKDCGWVDEYDIMDLNLVIRHLANKTPSLKLVIAKGDFNLTKKAKDMAIKEDHLSQTRARAIVVSGPIKAAMLNFIKSFGNKNYPLQFFNNREEAYTWLMSLPASLSA